MPNNKNMYDVAIVGGGPVGSQVAYKLAETGYHVVIIEKKRKHGNKICCTGIVSKECVESFAIPEAAIHGWAHGARLFTPSGKMISVRREEPPAAILNRPAFNEAWANRAQTKGAEYLLDSEVKSAKIGKKGVNIDVVNRSGTFSLQARAIVVTTGFGSRLMDELELSGAPDFVMGAQAEVETKDIEETEVYFGSKTAPSFFAWLVPTSPNKALLGLLSRRHPPAYLRSLLSRLTAEGKVISGNVPFTYGGVPLRPLPRTYGERMLVVGTAAGQVKPLTGGGIYFGLLCADIAANNLQRALSADDLSGNKLAGYERSWKRRLNREIRIAYWGRRLYEILTDRQVDSLFSLMMSSGLINELQNAPEISFDSHADMIARLLSQRLFLKAIKSMKLPFNLSGRIQ
jgi:digeranylgeranylglycerophospholipid reductase